MPLWGPFGVAQGQSISRYLWLLDLERCFLGNYGPEGGVGIEGGDYVIS